MELIPAIDIKGGRAVRLYQGDFSKEHLFSPDPVAVACQWAEQGAKRLHVVDLDGVLEGKPKNLALIKKIIQAVDIPVQFGGGLRDLEAIKEALDTGVDRVVLGTFAILCPDMVAEAVQLFGNRIVVSLDVRRGYLVARGWQERTKIKAEEFVPSLVECRVSRFIYTDTLRDGTLTQPNFKAICRLLPLVTHLIVGGGVCRLAHLRRLSRMGVEGVILGMALYTGMLKLRQAQEYADQEDYTLS